MHHVTVGDKLIDRHPNCGEGVVITVTSVDEWLIRGKTVEGWDYQMPWDYAEAHALDAEFNPVFSSYSTVNRIPKFHEIF